VSLDTAFRLRRLLAILAWMAQVGEAPIDETAARFDLSPGALVTELEMAACCGVPPYTPDQLMEIVVTDTTVSVRVGTSLARPRRLSPSEGFALATSARALLAVPGSDESGALSSALAKLDRVLGGEEGKDIGVELDAPTLLPLVRRAVADRRPLRISYYSASTDRVTDREIAPLRLFASEGHWYIDAWCRTAGDMRRFRVDRIGAAEQLDTAFPPEAVLDPEPGSESGSEPDTEHGPTAETEVDPRADPDPDRGSLRPPRRLDPFVPGPDSRRVRLSLDPATAWLVESVPATGPATTVGDRVEVELFVGGEAWLERLLLRLGPDARVIDPTEYRTLASDAAVRVLRRYEHETI
jgi:proteasome accessory factor C